MACLAGMLLFGACEDSNSSTIGTYEKEESTSSSEIKDAAKEKNNKIENIPDVSIDTAKSNDSTSNRKDTGILKLNKTKVKVQTKTAKATSKS